MYCIRVLFKRLNISEWKWNGSIKLCSVLCCVFVRRPGVCVVKKVCQAIDDPSKRHGKFPPNTDKIQKMKGSKPIT